MPLLRTRALEGMVNGKNVRGRRRYQMIDNIMINGQKKKNAVVLERVGEGRILL